MISNADCFFLCCSDSDGGSDSDIEFWNWPKAANRRLSCTVREHLGEVRWPAKCLAQDLKKDDQKR